MNTELPYIVRLAQALMRLNGLSVAQVATAADVQQENLAAWLRGTLDALNPDAQLLVMRQLGVERVGRPRHRVSQLTRRVHVWQDRLPRRGLVAPDFLTASVLLKDGEAVLLRGRGIGSGRLLLRSGESRVLLHLRAPFGRRAQLRPEACGLHWAGVPTRTVPAALRNNVLRGQMTPDEFDVLFEGTLAGRGWDDVRLIARDRGFSPAELIHWMTVEHPAATAAEMASTGAEIIDLIALAESTQTDRAPERDTPSTATEAAPASESAPVSEAGRVMRFNLSGQALTQGWRP